jgi:hypothetical protein
MRTASEPAQRAIIYFLSFFLQLNFVTLKVMLGRIFFVGYKSCGTNLDALYCKSRPMIFEFFAFCSMSFSGREVSTQNQGLQHIPGGIIKIIYKKQQTSD